MRSNEQRRLAAALFTAFAFAWTPAVHAQSGESPALRPAPTSPPVAPRIPKVDTLHGDVRVDDYYWLRQKTDSAVLRYIAAENEWTANGMRHTEALQEEIYKELMGRTTPGRFTAPVRDNGYWYDQRNELGKGYPIYTRRKGALTAPEEIIFDQNAAAAGRKFHALWAIVVSPSGRYLATLEDTTALRDNVLYVKDLATGRRVDSLVSRRGRALWSNTLGNTATSAMAWAKDDRTLFYLTADSAKRANAVWRHELGTAQSQDVKVFQDEDPLNTVRLYRSRSGEWFFIAADGVTSSEWHVVPTAAPTSVPRVLAPRRPGVVYAVDHGNGYFFRITNDAAPNFRILRAPEAASGDLRWEEWLANRDSVFVERIDVLRNFAVLLERAGGLRRLRVTDLRSNATHYVDFPEAAYDLSPQDNREFDTPTYRFLYSSFVTPHTWYDYDLARHTRVMLKQRKINGFDGSKYEVRRLMAPVRDGIRVPVSLLIRRGTRLDGKNPLLLFAYGASGVSMAPFFSLDALSIVDRGFVYAIAHVRGGSEMGPQWHEDGRMLRKRNTFTDFIDVAESLVKQGYTSPDRLVANGASGGGLLMGAVANMRPDLFRAIVAEVPAVDLLNTALDASLPGVTQGWKELGNPRDSVEYAYMRTYSPYDNVAKQAYPWMLVTTALNDSQVMYWEPTKWVAKLRAFKTDSNPLYLRVNYVGGHWGGNDAARETAFRFAFMLDAVGLAGTRP